LMLKRVERLLMIWEFVSG